MRPDGIARVAFRVKWAGLGVESHPFTELLFKYSADDLIKSYLVSPQARLLSLVSRSGGS